MKKILVAVLLSVFISGCAKDMKNAGNEPVVQNKDVLVATVPAKTEKYNPEINFSGTFKPFKEANLSAHFPGRIKKIHYKEGSRVAAGSVIVTLSGEMTKAAKAELDAVVNDYERVKDLVEKKVLPQQKLDHIQAKLDATNAKVEMMQSNMEIIAPFNGVVAKHMMREGEEFILLNPGLTPGFSHSSGIIRFMDIDKLLVEIEVSEKEIPDIEKMTDIEITAEAYPDKIMKGKVYSVESMVSTISRTVKVKIIVDNLKHSIKPGMFGKVTAKLPQIEAVMIPRMAVNRQPGSNIHFVFTEEKGVAVRHEIKIIDDLGDMYAVSGINDSSQVVTAGKTKLRSGMTVVVSNR
jgi:membrane fusion protein (multidrug efflux system)